MAEMDNFYTVTIAGHVQSVYPSPEWADWEPYDLYQVDLSDMNGQVVLHGDKRKLLEQIRLVEERLSELKASMQVALGREAD